MVRSFQRMGVWTVTSLVPSGNVASTCTEWSICAMPSMHCSAVMTCAPASIRSATLRPSRAPSTTKSVISATASGWLSRTPRASLPRATMAATLISSLSFSRGVGSIACLLVLPDAGQGAGAQGADQPHDLTAQGPAVTGHEADHQLAVKARGTARDARFIQQILYAGCGILGPLRHQRQRGEGARAVQDRGASGQGLGGEVERLNRHRFALAGDAAGVAQGGARDGLAHGGAAQDNRLEDQAGGLLRKVDGGFASELAAVEEDRFLRQPVEMRAGRDP